MTEKENQQMAEAYKSLDAYYEEISESVRDTIMIIAKEINVSFNYLKADFYDLMEDCGITSKIEFVLKPKGEKQDEETQYFKDIHIQQWSIGDSGDSFEGYIYAKFSKDKWIKVPYEC